MGSHRSSKERLKWTKELHDLFEKAVNQIGGPDRATPKGILKAMAIPGLTIFHVKSHLQKYRMSVFTREEDHTKGKLERRSVSEMLPNFCALSGAQLNEALLIQMEAQRRLSDQLEVQKSLKMKIEAQGRFLDKIMEEYKNRSPAGTKPYSPILSLPSLSDESDSDVEDVSEISSKEDFQPPKRIKIQQHHNLPCFNLDSHHLNLFSVDGITNQELAFPWVDRALSPSPLLGMYNHLNR
ncbi:myb family transcription factor PHL7-like [Salvia miltiorrhiza]|uniref:myb family transcription factor PHL7-like n=1 Tax=Salvia miltiorrhiza TaxID=226208 RepID=UPI0025ACB527|nr:myb family transcription factor PHL7-like [Salvia miltiorrhiza]